MSWLHKLFNFREKHEGDVVKPFLDHLEDLRLMIFKMGVSVVIGTIIAWTFHKQLFDILTAPVYAVKGLRIISTEIMGPFMISLKLSMYAGLAISFPALLYFLADFILPALTRKERRLLVPGIACGFVLFLGGVYASYSFILPKTLHFFYEFAQTDVKVEMMLDINKYLGFAANLSIACGLLCELPIVVIALAILGMVSYKLLSTTRPYAILMILVLVAIVAPSPDPFTFLALSAPVIVIYEICIWIVWLIERRKKKTDAASHSD